MDLLFRVTGTSPLLMHNPRMVDTEYEVSRSIHALTTKKKKTDEDLRQIANLEWVGGLYCEEIDGVMAVTQPTSKLRKSFIGAARISKQGKSVERALTFFEQHVPLEYDGPRDIVELEKIKSNYWSRLSVGMNGTKRVMRVRPSFYPWGLAATCLFIEDAGLNFDELQAVCELAGRIEGLGDNRVNGYGRFKISIDKL
jgi:hypothetical protein